MPQDYAASVQGVAIRVTRLDEGGNLLNGPSDSYTTSAFIRTSFTPEYETGDEITEKAADGTVCVSFKAPDTLKRVNLEIAICDPDPELSALMSGGLMLSGKFGLTGKEQVQGWASAQVGEDPSGNGVAVEVWSRAVQDGKPAGQNPYFRWVFPYVKTRLSGDRVIENGLLATTFEGFGLGNINFRSGIDETWRWPAAADRPYLYARENWAPQGLKGFYTWKKDTGNNVDDLSGWKGDEDAVSDDLAVAGKPGGLVGTNVPGGKNPYPYSSSAGADFILSQDDFDPNPTGATYPASAADQDVQNVPPTSAGAAQNPVTYLNRNDPLSLSGATGGVGNVTASVFGSVPVSANPTELKKLAIGTDLADRPAFGPDEWVVIGDKSTWSWDGAKWVAHKALTSVTMNPGTDAGVAAASGANRPASLGSLQQLGALGQTNAWTGGAYFGLKDGSKAYWDGNAWVAGIAP